MADHSPVINQPNAPPGYWARKGTELPWRAARKGSYLHGELLLRLQHLNAMREPSLRPSRAWEGSDFFAKIGIKRQNVEALRVQTVGQEAEDPCLHCRRGDGPFAGCVIAHECADIMPQCANCHWGAQGERCSLYKKAHPDLSAEIVKTAPKADKKRKLSEMYDGIQLVLNRSELLLSQQALQLQGMLDDINLEKCKLVKSREDLEVLRKELEE
ncbi:hypothetical protein PMG11_00019 [Penicillium brasilianum]|uniref:Uncharacterized protein n=1 Tax=Penicillium brasilianum TaxID=104259 RepID=A0A0F7TAW6_PENBI|nr:hypothetical protein PMG11_00019 [Penicillium brasilianum]